MEPLSTPRPALGSTPTSKISKDQKKFKLEAAMSVFPNAGMHVEQAKDEIVEVLLSEKPQLIKPLDMATPKTAQDFRRKIRSLEETADIILLGRSPKRTPDEPRFEAELSVAKDDDLLRVQDRIEDILVAFADGLAAEASLRTDQPTDATAAALLEERQQGSRLKQKLTDITDRMNKNDIQTDLIRGQLLRRNQLLDDQRRKYFKELRILREQLFQKDRLGDYYQAEDWGSYFNLESEAAAAELEGKKKKEEGGGGGAGGVSAKQVDQMKKDFEAQKQKLMQQMAQQSKELQSQVDRAKKDLEVKTAEFQKKETEMKDKHQKEIQDLNMQHTMKIQQMETAFETERQQMREEKERALREQREEYEQKIAELQAAMQKMRDQFESQISSLKSEIAAKQAQIDDLQQRIDAAMEELERAKTAMAEIIEEKERLEAQVQEQATKMKQMEEAAASHKREMEKLRLQNEELSKQLAEAQAAVSASQAREEEMAQLRQDNAELRQQLEQLRTSGSLPKQAVEQIEKAVEIDNQLQQEKAQTGWELLNSHLLTKERKDELRQLRPKGPSLSLDAGERAKQKAISRMSVFERLEQRASLRLERLRNKRLLLERERRRNMERCLMAVCLLVKPQPRVVPVSTITMTLGDEMRARTQGAVSSPGRMIETVMSLPSFDNDSVASSPRPPQSPRTPRTPRTPSRGAAASSPRLVQLYTSSGSAPFSPQQGQPMTQRASGGGRLRATITSQSVSYKRTDSPATPTADADDRSEHMSPRPESVEPYVPTSYMAPYQAGSRPTSARFSLHVPHSNQWSDQQQPAAATLGRSQSALGDYGGRGELTPRRHSQAQLTGATGGSMRPDFLSMNRVERREAILSMIYPDRRQPVSRPKLS